MQDESASKHITNHKVMSDITTKSWQQKPWCDGWCGHLYLNPRSKQCRVSVNSLNTLTSTTCLPENHNISHFWNTFVKKYYACFMSRKLDNGHLEFRQQSYVRYERKSAELHSTDCMLKDCGHTILVMRFPGQTHMEGNWVETCSQEPVIPVSLCKETTLCLLS